jgi:hypothetical protein
VSDAADCPTVESLAPELALGILSGSERAAALAHLSDCAACRRLVDELSTVADPLLLLAPEVEPSIGFESRVLAATSDPDRPGVTARHRRRPRFAFVRVVAAAAAVLVAAAGGLVVGRVVGQDHAVVRTAVAVTGKSTCRAFAYGDKQAWVFVSLEAPREWTADYTVEITTEGGGRAATVGQFRLQGGQGSFGAVVDVAASRLRAVRVLDASGALRYEAPFTTS